MVARARAAEAERCRRSVMGYEDEEAYAGHGLYAVTSSADQYNDQETIIKPRML